MALHRRQLIVSVSNDDLLSAARAFGDMKARQKQVGFFKKKPIKRSAAV